MSAMDDELDFDWGDGLDAPIDGERLRTLRIALGHDTSKLASAIGTSPSSINNWERNEKQPRRFLRPLCRELGVEPDQLCVPAPPPAMTGPFFRRRSSRKDPEKPRQQGAATARIVADIAEYLDRRVGLQIGPPSVVIQHLRRPQRAAQEVRRLLGLGPGPVPNMIRAAERAGAVVAYAPRLRASIDAYSLLAGRWPVIMLTPKGDYYRQRWDVAHELGHVVLHMHGPSDDDVREGEANDFAAEFLLPETEIISLLPSGFSSKAITEYRRIKEVWGVSVGALVNRAGDLGVMHSATTDFAEHELIRLGWRAREPGRMSTLESAPAIRDAVERYSTDVPFETMSRELGIPIGLFTSLIHKLPPA